MATILHTLERQTLKCQVKRIKAAVAQISDYGRPATNLCGAIWEVHEPTLWPNVVLSGKLMSRLYDPMWYHLGSSWVDSVTQCGAVWEVHEPTLWPSVGLSGKLMSRLWLNRVPSGKLMSRLYDPMWYRLGSSWADSMIQCGTVWEAHEPTLWSIRMNSLKRWSYFARGR